MKDKKGNPRPGFSPLSEHDVSLFKNGNNYRLYEKLGAHQCSIDEIKGTYFSVWAPSAASISVIGDFNLWDKNTNVMNARKDSSGIWEAFIGGVGPGSLYKFHIKSKTKSHTERKSDPFAFYCETSPKTASIVWALDWKWDDSKWMKNRYKNNSLDSPFAIYELHIGSWKRITEKNDRRTGSQPGRRSGRQLNGQLNNRPGRQLTYIELAEKLPEYIKKMGFTHVELMPVMEHPFYGSWGYQTTGYFAPTSRYGTPQDFMFLVDTLHNNEIGVILDWVPSHFPDDEHGLAFFDGTKLFEYKDPKKGFHPDWNSLIFNYEKSEVRQFLISSALFWLDRYHADGLRLDAVASMLYLNYSRKDGQWVPNKYGGKENLEAAEFIKELNKAVYENYPDVQTIAEESTAWPAVTKPVHAGGLGFGMKWNMGWMHDTLQYFTKVPAYWKSSQNELKLAFWYAFFENFVLPLSHDEVVYGKKSLLEKMPGARWQKFAGLRLLFSYMYGFPGKKLLFMGGDIGQAAEWDHEKSIDWDLLKKEPNLGLQRLVSDLNNIYRSEKVLYESDFSPDSFEWIDPEDKTQSTIFFLRKNADAFLLVASNFNPTPKYRYRIGVPCEGIWKEIFNSDSKHYGGHGYGNHGKVKAEKINCHGKDFSLSLTLPPLGVVFFKKDTGQESKPK